MEVKYDKSAGCGSIFKNGTFVKKHCGWSKNWYKVLCTNDKILFYDKPSGILEVYSLNSNGDMGLLQRHGGISKNWSDITYQPSGIVTFVQADGFFEAYKVDGGGNLIFQYRK